MARESYGNCRVTIGGVTYDKMLSLYLKRSKEDTNGGGNFVLSWPGAEVFKGQGQVAKSIVDGAMGEITLDDQQAAVIMIDTRLSKGTPKTYELTLQYRGITSLVTDSMPDHPTGQFNDQTPQDITKRLMQGIGIDLLDLTTGNTKTIKRFIVAEGETIARAARRALRDNGSINGPWENAKGQLVIEDAGTQKQQGQSLEIGRNFTQFSVKRDISPRFGIVTGTGTAIPTQQRYGKAAESLWSQEMMQLGNLTGQALMKRLSILVDGDHDKNSLDKRRTFEANRRSGQGLNVTLVVSTWSDDNGKLWTVGTKHHIKIPIDEVDDDCELTMVEFELTPTSRKSTLTFTGSGVWGGTLGGALVDQAGKARVITPPKQTDVPKPADASQTADPYEQQREQLRQEGLRRLESGTVPQATPETKTPES